MNNIATLKYKTVNNEVFAKYIKLKEELSIIEEENKVKKEEKILSSWESLFGNISGEVVEEEETPTFEQFQLQFQEDDDEEELDGLEVDIEFPQMIIDETVVPIQEEKEEVEVEEQQQQETTISTVEDFASSISEEEKNNPKVLKEAEDPIAIKIRKLEDMLRQLAMQSPGGGEVRLLKLDDVDTTNLANDKILKYTSSSGKLGFVSEAAAAGHEVTSGSTSITTAMSGVAINTQILDTPAGYVSIEVDGTTYKLPYYPE